MKNIILRFGLLAILLLVLLELGKYSLLYSDWEQEFILVLSALGLVAFGFILKGYLSSRKTLLQDQKIASPEKLDLLKISQREYEVLQKMAEGYSNQEIADQLFVSENTIKTHVSNLLSKLHAKRRTEAVKQGKEYGIL
ncbi:MAG: response regulator transcription factor [Cyclobacteriaceae bacterium]|nr:response regulator transcription factor [Cyclobacteriaceae bacterium SS2]